MTGIRMLLLACVLCEHRLPAADLSGRVVDAQDGGPVGHAQVTITVLRTGEQNNAPVSLTLLTDTAGNFRVSNLPEGNYQLSSEKTGYSGEGSFVASDGKSNSVVLHLTRQAVVSGMVVDDKGVGVPLASVQLFKPMVAEGRRQNVPMMSVQSDAAGEFRIFGIAAGRYYLGATAQVRTFRKSHRFAYKPTLYPGAADFSAAQLIELPPGAEHEVKIELRRAPAYQIRVQSLAGAQSVGAMLTPGESNRFPISFNFPTLYDNKSGILTVPDVPAGDYMLDASFFVDGHMFRAVKKITVEDHDVEGISVGPASTVEVSGQVMMDGKAPGRELVPYISLDAAGRGGLGTEVDEDGNFYFHDVVPDTYRLNIATPAKCFPVIRQSGREVEADAIVIGGDANEIEIEFSSHGGTIEGSIADPDFNATTAVSVGLYRRSSAGLVFVRQVEAGGSATPRPPGPPSKGLLTFTFEGIRPADYVVLAWAVSAELAYAEPQFIGEFSGQGKTIQVRAEEKISVTVDSVLKPY